MIKHAASTISSIWVKNGVADGADQECYRYGMELLLSTSVNVFLLFVVSVFFGHPLAFVPYLLSFIPLRLLAGDYHAKAHWSCVLITVSIYLLLYLVMSDSLIQYIHRTYNFLFL